MFFDKKRILKWFVLGSLGLVSVFIGFSLILNLAVSLMEQREAVLEFGKSVDGAGSYFNGIRIVMVLLIIFYWKEIVRWVGKAQKLNLRQIYILKKIHPYVVGMLVLIELLDMAF